MVEGHTLEIDVRNEAERKRSSEEARRRESENLASPPSVTRYMNPPQDTVYALEYAYYLLGNVLNKTCSGPRLRRWRKQRGSRSPGRQSCWSRHFSGSC